MEKIIENISDFRTQIAMLNGATQEVAEAKAANAAQEFRSIPIEGEVEKLDYEVYGFDGENIIQLTDESRAALRARIDAGENNIPNIRVSIGVRLKSGEFVSENQFSASTVILETQVVKSKKNNGKIMLVQERVSPEYFALGESSDKRLKALLGRSYKATKLAGLGLKLYKPEAMFAPTGTSKSQALTMLKNNTEPKTYNQFTII